MNPAGERKAAIVALAADWYCLHRRGFMWVRAIVLSLCVVSLFGADAAAVKKEIQTFIDSADRERASGDFQKAEKTYQAAIRKCDLLPSSDFHSKTDLLQKLGNLYANMADPERAEMIFKERIAILTSHERLGGRPDLDLGIALFDLQITLEGANLTNTKRDAEAQEYVNQAQTFYQGCKDHFPDLRSTCDRRLADVEGFHGSALFLKNRLDEAAPLLKAVADRPDSGVRKETLTMALEGYAKTLMRRGKGTEAEPILQRLRRLNAEQ